MTRSQRIYLYLFWVNTFGYYHVSGSYKFNALSCDLCAPELAFVKQCNIKAIDRKHNMINIEAFLNKTISEFSIHFIMVKRESGGWHPFMYNIKMDICKYFKNPRKFFIPNLIYSFIKPFTNVNHSCPYEAGSYMSLLRWSPNEESVLAKFPVDHGQYGLHTTWYINKISALQINGSVLFFK
ncbi:uncharacterized protein LOC110186231 [Drosophila serrata]|uniref:uncharacterized protein LOC110186231 n=1 Tax=Drosophila serrata TaxID=7274 RepID=UPI000A1D0080|nr:uncharacterized protein LOC110186231 [Drosophila serrata]